MFVKIFQVSAIEEVGLFCINFSGWWTSFCCTSFAVLINIACLFKIIIASELRAEGLVYLPTLVLQLVANIIFFLFHTMCCADEHCSHISSNE